MKVSSAVKQKIGRLTTVHLSQVLSVVVAVIPRQCQSYVNDTSLNCLEALWRRVGCRAHGVSSPGKLLPLQRMTMFAGKNLRYSLI